MDIATELILCSKLLAALLLGGFIGVERERGNKDAGLRTYASVCMGACLFVIIASHLTQEEAAIARVVAAVVTGIGFIGAGIIFKDSENRPKGLTTAATLWSTASVGVALALGMFTIAIFASALIFFILSLTHLNFYRKWISKIKQSPGDID